MPVEEFRSNWLSEIIEANRHISDRPIPLLERKAERDAILAAIKSHPEGRLLEALPDLPDLVWEALGAAYHLERDAQRSPHLVLTPPAIYASQFILNAARPHP